MELHPDSVVIDRMGGPTKVAALCELSPQAITQWRRPGIPKPWRKYLQLLNPEAFNTATPRADDDEAVRAGASLESTKQ